MKARIARLVLSSMLSTGILGGFLVEPNYPLLRQFTQPAHADQCDGGEVYGHGFGRTHQEALTRARNSMVIPVGMVPCGTMTEDLLVLGPDYYIVNITQRLRRAVWFQSL